MARQPTRKQREALHKRQLEEQRAQRQAERDLKQASRPLFGTPGTGKGAHRKPTLEVPSFASDSKVYPSIVSNSPLNTGKPLKYESEELAAREAAAQEQIKVKRGRVAVICHKSGYQYVGESEDPRTFGKKSQALE